MANIFKSFDDESLKDIANSQKFKKVAEDKNVQDFVNNKQFIEFKEKYKNKSDEEILKDAREFSQKLKQQYGEKEFNKKIQDLKNIERFLNPEQKKKMKKFLDQIK